MTISIPSAAAGAFLAVNVAAFVAFFLDKTWARRGARRVPERTLQGLALLGGFAGGAAGIILFRHKTRKKGFLALFAAASLLSIAAWLAVARAIR
jgi:uncharacterized membrane protein YsdA (DUF1294 family)